MLLHENVLDLTHFNYLHRNSFGITNRNTPEYSVEGNQVISRQVVDCTGYSADELAAERLDSFTMRTEETGRFVTPALHSAETVAFRRPNSRLPELETSYINHCVTPENPPARTIGGSWLQRHAARRTVGIVAIHCERLFRGQDDAGIHSTRRRSRCPASDYPEFSSPAMPVEFWRDVRCNAYWPPRVMDRAGRSRSTSMQHNDERIPTTHVGSLVRTPQLVELEIQRFLGERVDPRPTKRRCAPA